MSSHGIPLQIVVLDEDKYDRAPARAPHMALDPWFRRVDAHFPPELAPN